MSRDWFCIEWSAVTAIHLHQSDAQMDAQGWGKADIICHACGAAWTIVYPAYSESESTSSPLQPLAFSFASGHLHPGGLASCRQPQSFERVIDLREVAYA